MITMRYKTLGATALLKEQKYSHKNLAFPVNELANVKEKQTTAV